MHPNVRCRIDRTYVTLVVTGPGTVTAVARARRRPRRRCAGLAAVARRRSGGAGCPTGGGRLGRKLQLLSSLLNPHVRVS
jgi:hypothetical protein